MRDRDNSAALKLDGAEGRHRDRLDRKRRRRGRKSHGEEWDD
jgi:hypothetical protein